MQKQDQHQTEGLMKRISNPINFHSHRNAQQVVSMNIIVPSVLKSKFLQKSEQRLVAHRSANKEALSMSSLGISHSERVILGSKPDQERVKSKGLQPECRQQSSVAAIQIEHSQSLICRTEQSWYNHLTPKGAQVQKPEHLAAHLFETSHSSSDKIHPSAFTTVRLNKRAQENFEEGQGLKKQLNQKKQAPGQSKQALAFLLDYYTSFSQSDNLEIAYPAIEAIIRNYSQLDQQLVSPNHNNLFGMFRSLFSPSLWGPQYQMLRQRALSCLEARIKYDLKKGVVQIQYALFQRFQLGIQIANYLDRNPAFISQKSERFDQAVFIICRSLLTPVENKNKISVSKKISQWRSNSTSKVLKDFANEIQKKLKDDAKTFQQPAERDSMPHKRLQK